MERLRPESPVKSAGFAMARQWRGMTASVSAGMEMVPQSPKPQYAESQTASISTTVNNATTTQWKTTTFYGFGRPIRVQTGNNGVAVANVDTQYGPCGCSPLGKMTKTSMPYAPGATVYWTTNTYDGSGRTLTQTKPDGSVTTTSYAGNAVTVTDPAGKWKTYYSDMAGGLTTVAEPNPGNATNPVTYYYLNGAGQITQVSVQRNGVAQNRYFTWSGSDMTSSTTPEAGTVTYTYDGNHHVLTRTDAKSQQTKYTYDTYERLIEVQHYTATGFNGSLQEQTNQQVGYGYDVNPLDPGNYLNSWGRLTQVTFQEQTVNGNSFAYLYSYNQAGRVTANTLLASNGGNLLTNLKATYTWDNQGRMTNLTYPSGTSLAYQYDAMGRLSTMTSSNYPNNPYPLTIATATYTAASQLNTLQYGVNATFNESRSYNTLMQLTNLTVSGSGSVNMQYSYTAGQNNGRVSQTTDGVLGETVNYGYDMWNRLTSATATNGSWGEAYTFDGFGNLTGKTPTAGSARGDEPIGQHRKQPADRPGKLRRQRQHAGDQQLPRHSRLCVGHREPAGDDAARGLPAHGLHLRPLGKTHGERSTGRAGFQRQPFAHAVRDLLLRSDGAEAGDIQLHEQHRRYFLLDAGGDQHLLRREAAASERRVGS